MNTHEAPVDVAPRAREEILLAAAELFMDFGFTATSIDAIAAKTGATKGRVYHYFSSKAEVFFEVQRTAMRRLIDLIEPIARADRPASGKLRAMGYAHLGMLLDDMPLQKVSVQGLERYLFETSGYRYARQLREINNLRDDYEQIFADVIDVGIREGSFVDLPPRLLTKPFFGTLNWVMVWYRPSKVQNPESVKFMSDALVDYAMRGIHKGDRNDNDWSGKASPF